MRAQDGTSAVQPARLGGRRAASCRSRILAVVLTALAGTALLASGARAASYPYATVTGTGSDTFTAPNALTFTNPADGTANSDDGTAALTLPFAFTIFGHSYAAGTTLHVSTNGVLEFADNQRSWTNTALPTSTFTGPAILPYWTDFDLTVTHDVIPSGGGEGAAWGVNNSAPNRVLVVRWWGYRHGTLPESRIGLEVALAEGTNRIDTLYTRALTTRWRTAAPRRSASRRAARPGSSSSSARTPLRFPARASMSSTSRRFRRGPPGRRSPERPRSGRC